MAGKSYELKKEEITGKPGEKRADGRTDRLIAWMSLFLLAVSLILQVLARRSAGFGQWYAVTVYPALVGSVGRFGSLFPFSLSEVALYLLFAGCLVYGIRRRDRIKSLLCRTFFLLCLLFFLFTVNCGVNYYRLPFSRLAGFEVKARTKGELVALCDYLTEQVNLAAAELDGAAGSRGAAAPSGSAADRPGAGGEPGRTGAGGEPEKTGAGGEPEKTGAGGEPEKTGAGGEPEKADTGGEPGRTGTGGEPGRTARYASEAVRAMGKLGEQYPPLAGYYPRPKRLLVSRILSIQQLAGIYSPFTVEANYNGEMTPYNIPHTVCHELSHLRGFMREDEANFIGFLACIGSDDAQFRYSGWALGFIYAGNALALTDREAYIECYNRLAPKVKRDYDENSAFWSRFDTKVAEAADKLNNTYLKANSQADGTKSYGRAVDLMLAWYAAGGRG